MAISGTTAVVGASGANSNTGAVYVFTKGTYGWTQSAELTASDGAANDGFGLSVALSGTKAAVGAPYHNNAGATYVFAI